MDLLGACLFGFVLGAVLSYRVIKKIARSNKQQFITKLSEKYNVSNTPKGEMIVDAIGSEIDLLMKHHGERVKVEDGHYYMCWIDQDLIALPSNCLVPIHDQAESE